MTEQDDILELAKVFNEITTERVEEGLKSVREEIRSLKQRGSRPPVLLGPSSDDAGPLVSGDAKFTGWLREARTQKSAFVGSYAGFHIEHKASPLLNTGGTAHAGGIAGPPQTALRLAELFFTVPMTQGGAVEYGRESGFTPNAQVVAEGVVKPITSIDYVNALALVKTIATISKASVQSLSDTPGLGMWLDARLRYAVQLRLEDVLLNAAAPDGLLASAVALDPAYAPGAAATPLDVIAAAISQLTAQGYSVDGCIVNGVDAAKMRLLKDGDDNYIWASPDSSVGTAGVWSVPLVISPSMPVGQWLVGAFRQCCVLFERQLLVVEIAFENEDDFVRNLVCIRAEERIASAVAVPQGLVKGSFAVTPPLQQEHASAQSGKK